MKENVTKREFGITLVALVITVIILLILAGVALSMITGQNGLFARTNQASFDYMDKAGDESDKVNGLQGYLEQYDIYSEESNNNNNNDNDNNNVNDDPYYGGLADGKTIIQDIFLYETTQEPSGDTKGKAGVIGINWDYVISGYSAGTEGAGSWTSGPTYASTLRDLVVPYEVTLNNKVYEINSVQLGGGVRKGQAGTPFAYFTWTLSGATTDQNGIERDMTLSNNMRVTAPDEYSFPKLASGSNYAYESTSSDISYITIPSTVQSLSLGAYDDGYNDNVTRLRIPT